MGLMTPAQEIILLGGSTPAWLKDLKAKAGATPALALAFDLDQAFLGKTKTSISSLLSCSRASTGYYTKADGTLTSFGNNVLRYGTNGLLVEEARTNLILRSQQFDNVTWNGLNHASISADAIAAPDGTTTADRLVADNTSAWHYVLQAFTYSSIAYTASFYVKADTQTWCYIECFDGASAHSAYFNMSGAGAVGTTSGTSGTSITALANGWYWCTMTFTASAGTNYYGISPANANGGKTYTGDNSTGIYLWGAQLEAGSFATSYIPTTSASATRAADAITFSSIPAVVTSIASGSGSMFIQYPSTNINDGYYFEFGGNRPVFYKNTSSTNASYDGTTTDLNSKTEQATTGAVNKLARSWNTTNLVGAINGAASSSVGYDGNWNIGTPAIGRYGASLHYINSYLQRLAVFDVALAGAALTTLTT